MSVTEAEIQSKILVEVGALPHVRLFRNNVGVAVFAGGQRIRYGLCHGSSDLIGMTQIVVTPDMVGAIIAVFTAAEVKRLGVKPEPLQANFLQFVRDFGGRADVVRSVEDAVRLVTP
jgi:hypothetical protein